jgi:hypothetical protein
MIAHQTKMKNLVVRDRSMGYNPYDLMKFCTDPTKERFGVIEFAIGVKVSVSFKQAVGEVDESEWRRLYRKTDKGLAETGQEYAEVCFVPAELARKKDGPEFRYLAGREVLEQPCMEWTIKSVCRFLQ